MALAYYSKDQYCKHVHCLFKAAWMFYQLLSTQKFNRWTLILHKIHLYRTLKLMNPLLLVCFIDLSLLALICTLIISPVWLVANIQRTHFAQSKAYTSTTKRYVVWRNKKPSGVPHRVWPKPWHCHSFLR